MPATPIDLGTALLEAVKEVSGLLKEWIAGADIRRMKAAIEAGEKYIFENEKPDSPKKAELLEYWKNRFFKFN